jgi:hypothetical protein
VQEITELEEMPSKAAHLQGMIDRTEKGVAILGRFRQGSEENAEGSSAKASFLNVKATARSVAQKAIGASADLVGVEFIHSMVPIDRPRTSLFQAIPAITRSSPVYEYLRQMVRMINAGPVAEGALNTSGNFDFGPTTPVNEAEMKLWGADFIESPAVTVGTVRTYAEGANTLSTDGKVDARRSESMSDDLPATS